jgi:hypothetical protein
VVLDPGSHSLRFEAAGFVPVERELVLRSGERDRREKVVFVSAASARPSEARGLSPLQIGGVALASAGVAGIVVGAVFGLKASSDRSSEIGACGATCATVADQNAAASYRSSFTTDSTVSTVAVVAGSALVATGAVLFFVIGKTKNDAPDTAALRFAPGLGPGGACASLKGTF